MKLANVSLRNLMNGFFIICNTNKYKKTQFLSRSEIIDIQTKKLKFILEEAVNNVPFYFHLQNKIDFENFKLAELEKFPVVTKRIIRDNYDSFLSRKFTKKVLEYKATSGSSGEPFKVPKAFYSDGIEQCMMFRAWSMNPEYDYKFRDPCIVLRSFSPEPGELPYKIDYILNYWYLSPFDINDRNIYLYYDFIKRSCSKIIRAYPSSLYILTLFLEKYNLRLPQIKTLFTSSENLLPSHRNKITDFWQLQIIDWYGQNERTVTVQKCEHGIYHNNDEYGIVELDSNNQIIATSLNNNIMPLIRYATNDLAQPTKINQCKCGRGLSIPFESIDGRADDLLVKADGSIVPAVNIYNAMEKYQFINQFRIIQNSDKSIQLELASSVKLTPSIISKIENELSIRLGNILIFTTIVDEIVRDPNTGKIKSIISKVKL